MATTPNTESPRAGWNLWFRWVGAHIVAAILIGVATFFVAYPIVLLMAFGGGGNIPAMILAFGGGMGAVYIGIVGVLQWLVLRAELPLMRRWPVASMIGGALVGLLLLTPSAISETESIAAIAKRVFDITDAIADFAGPFVALFIIGTAQWFVMRQQLSQSGWWILASMTSGLIGPILAFIYPIPFGWYLVSIGLLYPCVTGIALIWLIKHSATQRASIDRAWIASGSVLLILGLIALFWGGLSQPRYVNRHDSGDVVHGFSEALRINQADLAKSLTVPEQWDRIDTWMADHTVFICPLGSGRFGAQHWHNHMLEESFFFCNSKPSDTFSVSKVEYEEIGDVYVIVNWEKICETRNGKRFCE